METVATLTLGGFALGALAVTYMLVESALHFRARCRERSTETGAWL